MDRESYACRTCDSSFEVFLSFGQMPLGNGFLSPHSPSDEYRFPLEVGLCEQCGMVQLAEQPDAERMFHEEYAFFSSTSRRMAAHFGEFAGQVRQRLLDPDPFVVELGSNDGIMLRHFADAGVRHLGIEPSANVAVAAREKGVQTICRFFNQQTAEDIIREHGRADAILAANVICHIADLRSVLAGIKELLSPEGLFIYEDPYLGDILTNTSYDQIYDEHVFYFSLASVSRFVAQYGLEVVDVASQNVHGGSMRYSIAHRSAHPVSDAVTTLRQQEDRQGLTQLASFHAFRDRVEQSRTRLRTALREVRATGARIVGYGATSKSTTVLNYCGIGPDDLEFISDTTPGKQGKLTPGSRIPVRPYDDFVSDYPEYALLFAWNHRDEIMANEDAFRNAGGRWIQYVPEVTVEL